MKPRARQALIYGTLLVTALAAVLAPEPISEPALEPEDEAMQPVREALAPAAMHEDAPAAMPAVEDTVWLPKPRLALAESPKDLFHIEPPPRPAVDRTLVAAAPPPAPMAPPLPYTYMGKLSDQGQLAVFLTRNGKPYVARPGDVLDGQYRVDAIRPPVLELTYLPLEQKQTLNIGTIR
jgi:hypothetical protein